jgi:hypothetical protein
MDLSKLSTEDLVALKAGDLSKVSTEGLQHLRGQSAPAAPQSMTDKAIAELKDEVTGLPGRVGNLAAGLVRGAGSIGATILAPKDIISDALDGKGLTLESNRKRRADMDATLRDVGADTDSLQFRVGKLGVEVAGTAGAGGVVANGARALGAAPEVVSAIGSGGFAGGGNALTRAAGGAINGAATAGLVNPEDAPKGMVVGSVLPGAVQLAGKAGNALYEAAKDGSRRLMQSAIKPTLAQRASGDADVAVDTLLQYGINPNKAGVNKIRELIDAKNAEISSALSGSTATVRKQDVLNRLGEVRDMFRNQVSPQGDLSAIEGVANNFSAHPAFQNHAEAEQALKDALAKATSEKVTALQAAGKLKTFAAQQQSLAEGKTLQLSASQPENELYYNTGGIGRQATSPSSLPVPGFPRIPSRYTHNIDRVAEGESGAKDATDIFTAKRAEEAAAAKALEDFQQTGEMTVQQAQKLKQGTYRVLQGKYGEAGSAETEAQKGLARGLKEEIATAVPGIQGLNEAESRLIKTLDVVERRALLEMNKNPVGLTALAKNPIAAAGFLADRSAAFKALAARLIHNATPAAGAAGQKLLGTASNPLLRATGLVASESNP